jgi:DNA-directed RNA polymerase subunit RPC12/RpoP
MTETRGHVVGLLQSLAVLLEKGERVECPHCGKSLHVKLGGWAAQVRRISWVAAAPAPADGCRRCGAPVEPVTFGRPRKFCERCSPPRRKVTQSGA